MPQIRVLIIRHGQRQKTYPDQNAKLTDPEGVEEVNKLASRLTELEVVPDVYFTSAYAHATQTAEGLRNQAPAKIIEVDALTPHTSDDLFSLENIFGQAKAHRIKLHSVDTIALVGHENRLSQLVTFMTGKRIRPLDLLDVVCLEAKSLQALTLGCAEIVWRLPVRAYDEDKLRPKVASKMTVATFLAGFTFTALMQIITNKNISLVWDWAEYDSIASYLHSVLPLISTIFLTAALALFIAAIYIYDRLSMPEGFWGTTRAPKFQNLPKFVQKNKDQYGLVYAHMIHAWLVIFTPAVFLAAAGFLLLVVSVKPDGPSYIYLTIMIVVGIIYWNKKPQLGVD